MKRVRVALIAAFVVAGTAAGVLQAAPAQAAAFGPGNANWDAYYANPSDTSKWSAFCGGGGGSVVVQAVGVPACGPTGSTSIALKGPNNVSTPGFQCVELTDRYLYVTKGWNSEVANGAGVARAYAAAHSLPTVTNGTAGKAPQVGDVISFSNQSNFSDTGHAAIVSASNVNGSGNGTVTILNQNVSLNSAPATAASLSLNVANWNVDKLGFNFLEWLPVGSPPPAVPAASVGNATVTETNAATTLSFTVTLSTAPTSTVSVQYATANKTAKAPADYTATSGTLTFLAGEMSKPVNVTVAGDTLYEVAETLLLNLSNPSGMTIAKAQGTGKINNDDPMPSLSIGDVSKAEGAGGTTSKMTFTVTLSTVSGATTKVKWATNGGTAVAGSDYTAANGTVSIPAGTISKTFTVTITGDNIVEPNETILVNLTGPVNATIADNQAVGTITNDD